jgi:hypothetical protein
MLVRLSTWLCLEIRMQDEESSAYGGEERRREGFGGGT